MNQYKVAVYAICKNEEKFVDLWMDNMAEADLIVVTDTGSTDRTVERLKDKGAVVHQETIKPWRFDVARNVSLSHVPDDVDICVCTDLDERFEPGWREKLEAAWSKNQHRGPKRARYTYNWSLKPDGSPGMQFMYSKIHTRNGYIWKYPIHEWLTHDKALPDTEFNVDGMVLNHYPDSEKSRGSYMPLLEMAVKEDPTDVRMTYYLGREYMFYGIYKKAIDTLQGYLKLEGANWDEERSAGMSWIAKCYQALGRFDDAAKWHYKAIAEAPHMRDPLVRFAMFSYERGDWAMTYFLVEEALKIQRRSQTFTNDEMAWDSTLYDIGAVAAYQLKVSKRALELADQALKMEPFNERLKKNVELIQKSL